MSVLLWTVKCLPHISWLSLPYLKRLSPRILEFRYYSLSQLGSTCLPPGAEIFEAFITPTFCYMVQYTSSGTLAAITLYSTVIITWNKELENVAIGRIIGPLFTTSRIKSPLKSHIVPSFQKFLTVVNQLSSGADIELWERQNIATCLAIVLNFLL